MKGRVPATTIEQALSLLRTQWADGTPDLMSVVQRLIEPSIEDLFALVAVDIQLAHQAGESVTAIKYVDCLPQLSEHYESLETLVESICAQRQSSVNRESTAENDFKTTPVGSSPAVSAATGPGTRTLPFMIGNFMVERFLGRGRFGTVWQARDLCVGRKVALKVREDDAQKGLSKDFLHEAQSIGRLEHPNIVRLYQAAETEDRVGYLVYEFVEGCTLENRIDRGDYSISKCVQWIASIADALDHAHQKGVVHRDISTRNIMIAADDTARLLDFGLSRVDDNFYTEERERVLGTPAFVSPEQASGKSDWATAYSDQFSLGSVLYYALTRKLPFGGKSTFDILEKIQKATPTSPRSIRKDLPLSLERACLRALAKEPQMRYSTAADMSAALLKALEVASPPRSPSSTSQPVGRSQAGNFLVVAGSLLTILGIVIATLGIKEFFTTPSQRVSAEVPTIEEMDLVVTLPNSSKVKPISLLGPLEEDVSVALTQPMPVTFSPRPGLPSSASYIYSITIPAATNYSRLGSANH